MYNDRGNRIGRMFYYILYLDTGPTTPFTRARARASGESVGVSDRNAVDIFDGNIFFAPARARPRSESN